MRRARALVEPTVLLAFLAGCSGSGPADGASDPAAGGSSSGTVSNGGSSGTGKGGTSGVSGGGTSGSSGAGGTGAIGGEVVCPSVEIARTPLRRLTRFEYTNSVRDLLQVDPAPVKDLPSDEVTNGFDNNSGVLTVSGLHAEKYVLVSEALAKTAVMNLAALTTCDPAATGDEACATQFAQSFGRRAFRRPLTPADEQAFLTAYRAGRTGGSHAEGIEVMIRAALQSPNFLYRLEPATQGEAGLVPVTQFELATRLSYLIWASGPDDALLDAAQRGELASREAVAQKAREMLADPKSRLSVSNFFGQWTSTNRLDITSKDTMLFPSYSNELRDAMARELPAFLAFVLAGDHTLGTLLTAPVAFVSGPLAPLYGVTAPSGSETTPMRVDLPANQGRAGILTQAGFLSVQAHPDQTSPVLRGKFVRGMMLCQPPPPPPDDVDITLPEIDQGATARERFGAHLTAGASCSGCHTLMDPIGLAFEHFDAMGQFRETDGGQAIDVSGEVTDTTDPALQGAFVGVSELAQKLASSELVRSCVATQWFRFASGRLEGPPDSCSLGTLQKHVQRFERRPHRARRGHDPNRHLHAPLGGDAMTHRPRSTNPLRFTRRNLIRGSLAATAAIPLLDARRVEGQMGAPTRLVVFMTPNGTRNNMFWPTGSETNYTLGTLTTPLEPHKSKLLFTRGIRLNNSLQNGALGGTLGSEHARGTGGLLTARPLNSGTEFISFGNTTSGWGSGQSIDQYLADRLMPATTHKSMQLGVHVRDAEVRARISYRATNQPMPPREDPRDVFSALFGTGTGTGMPGMPDPALERLRAQRQSVFDLTRTETERLKTVVGAEDRVKLDAHLTAMRDVEQRLTTVGPGPGTTGCVTPTMQPVDLTVDDQYLQTGRLQMDLAAAALACDQTRIITLQWSYSESEHLFQFLQISGNHHAISHDFASSGTNYTAYNRIQTWYAEQLAYFLAKLDSYQEGDRTLLDNTLVLWATEIGESTQHDLMLMPYVLAGSAGGKIRTGRFVDYGTTRHDNNKLLVSLAHAMGADDLTSFGDASGATGPLPSLV